VVPHARCGKGEMPWKRKMRHMWRHTNIQPSSSQALTRTNLDATRNSHMVTARPHAATPALLERLKPPPPPDSNTCAVCGEWHPRAGAQGADAPGHPHPSNTGSAAHQPHSIKHTASTHRGSTRASRVCTQLDKQWVLLACTGMCSMQKCCNQCGQQYHPA
jgi:hypothetical protein